MDVRQQEYFVAIAEEKSISKAAQKLFISQPTLSQFLSRLENTLGFQLIERSNNGNLSLTKAGELFYESCRQVLFIRDDLAKKLQALQSSQPSELIIGNNLGMASYLTAEIIPVLLKDFPNVHVDFFHGNSYRMFDMVLSGELDVAITGILQKHPLLEYLDLPPIEQFVVLPPGHPLFRSGASDPYTEPPRVSLKELENETFVLLRQHTIMRDQLDQYCKEQDISLNSPIEAYDSNFACSVVTSGLGIGLYAATLIHPRQREGLSYLALDPPLYYNMAVYYKKTSFLSPILKHFLSLIRPHLADLCLRR